MAPVLCCQLPQLMMLRRSIVGGLYEGMYLLQNHAWERDIVFTVFKVPCDGTDEIMK